MKIFFDTEFIEDGRTIELLSIGMVREDGLEFYSEAMWTDRSRASDWVRENVIPNLTGPGHWTREKMATDIISFAGLNPEFWAYYADYDWVVLCQLFGTMMDLPGSWPMYCRDFKQWLDDNGNPRMSEQGSMHHNAIADARHLKENFDALMNADAPPSP